MAWRGAVSCQGTKPRISILMRLNRGLCVSDVVERDLSFISSIFSPPNSSGRPRYGPQRVFWKKCRVGGPDLCRVVVPGERVRPGRVLSLIEIPQICQNMIRWTIA